MKGFNWKKARQDHHARSWGREFIAKSDATLKSGHLVPSSLPTLPSRPPPSGFMTLVTAEELQKFRDASGREPNRKEFRQMAGLALRERLKAANELIKQRQRQKD
jgi:hypothetical protein